MSASSDAELLRRLISFEREHARDAAELVEAVDEGSLVLSPAIDQVWSANYLEVEPGPHDGRHLAARVDRLLGDRGYRHRHVVPTQPEYAERLAGDFLELGWGAERSVYMRLARPSERGGAPAREVSREETDPVRRAVRSRRTDLTPEAVEQILVWDARLDRTANGRSFAAFHDGKPASACVLYERDGIGQVEKVATLPELNGHGFASGVVLAAVEASRRAGHELTFIVADADDWPWKLYERLGFERVGVTCSFLRKPDQAGSEGRSP